jgi:hypothetical protein
VEAATGGGLAEPEHVKALRLAVDGPGPPRAFKPFAFPTSNQCCVAFFYGRAGRLTAENGGFRPGQAWWRLSSRRRRP